VTRAPSKVLTTSTGTLIVDTGPGGTDPGPALFGGSSGFPGWQYLGGQFTLASSTDIGSISAWLKVFIGGDVTVHIRTDESGEPGTDVFTKTYTVATTADYGWYEFTDYTVTLPAGTYWITLETPINGGLIISMPNGAANPLSKYAFESNFLPSWNQAFGSTPSMGFRIAAPVVTPSQMIGTLTTYVSGTALPTGTKSSINSKLTTADDALAVSDVPTACGSLGAVLNYTTAQTNKTIPLPVATEIKSQTTGIRTTIGC
jgi:hypothetical protein